MTLFKWVLILTIIIHSTQCCNVTIDEDDHKLSEQGLEIDEIRKSDNVADNFHYSLMPESSVMSIGLNGKLFFKRGSDRERLCLVAELSTTCKCQDSLCRIPLGIWRHRKTSGNHEPPTRWRAVVCIRDKNDNCPTLPRTIPITISENVKPGWRMPLPVAEDKDSSEFSKTVYKVTCDPDSTMFSLVSPLSDQRNFLELALTSVVDHETAASHSCQLEACENSCCNSATVTISVTDENDHSPVWSFNNWMASIQENSSPNVEIMQLFATDGDTTFNQLTYSIIDVKPHDLFMIESKTGKIRLVGYLDYDTMTTKEVYIIVKVVDNGLYNPLSATGTVTVVVEDVNDNRPMIVLENNVISLVENAPSTYLGFMSVSDSDSGQNKIVSCIVSEPNDKVSLKPAKLESPNQVFDIYSTVAFDHEVDPVVTVKITCHDMGRPKLSSEAQVTLQIIDLDDNDVRFVRKEFRVGIEEEKEIGSFILKLEAVDLDSSSVIEYQFKNRSHATIVELDPQKGVLRTGILFDREAKDEYLIPVIVREKLSPNKTDEAVIVLRILDVNDNDPRFNQLYSFSVSENKDVNSEIGRVSAVDRDLRNNGTVVYSQQSLPRLFFVEPSGKIRLFQKLDYENQSLHHLVILASDLGVPQARTSTTTVIVSVIDENDNPPQFKQRYYQIEINCDTRFVNRDIYHAVDNDTEPKNRQMEYQVSTVEPQAVTKYIRIDKQSGEISFDFDQNPEMKCSDRPSIMKIKVNVFDPSVPNMMDYCFLRISRTISVPDGGLRDFKTPAYKDMAKESGNQQSDDFGVRKNQFEYNLLIVIIFIVLSLMLVLLLTCVAVFARRCKQEELAMSNKMDNECPSPINHSYETPHRSSIIKSNNIPNTEFQMLYRQQTEDDFPANNFQWGDPSDNMASQFKLIRGDGNDYQMLGHGYTMNPPKNYTYPHQYQDNQYLTKPFSDSEQIHQPILTSAEKNCAFFSKKPTVSTSFV